MEERRTIEQILTQSRTIAVVGASKDPNKAAHRIPLALQQMGYRIIPVNPNADVLFGEHVHKRLATITEQVDIVDVFRPSDQTPDIARQAAAINANVLWLQLGITSAESRSIASAAGMDYVEDRCLMIEASHHPAGRSHSE